MNEQPQSNKALVRIREILFFFSFGVFLIRRLFFDVTLWYLKYPQITDIRAHVDDIYTNYVPKILIACIFFTFFTTRPKISRLCIFIAMIISGKLVSIANEDLHFYLMMLLVVAAFGISAKKIAAFVIGVNFPSMIVTVIASQRGLVENRIDPGRNREYLGYNWTTTPVMIFSYGVFGYVMIRKGKITIWEYIILNGINYWFFVKTNTRFAFLIVFLILTFFMVYQLVKEQAAPSKLFRALFILLPHIFFASVYAITMLYTPNSSIMTKINRLLSNRLAQCQYSLGKYGYLPFGQAIRWVTIGQSTPDNPPTYVDTAYLQTLLKFGVVSIVLMLILSSFIMYRSFKNRSYAVAIIFAFILLFGLFEQQPYWIEFNMILLFAFADWSKLQEGSPSLPQLELKHQY